VIILIAEGTVDEAYYYSSMKRERFMKSLISTGQDKKPEDRRKTGTSSLLDYM
jgi:ERCC4-related helicase